MKIYQCGIKLFEIMPRAEYIKRSQLKIKELWLTKYNGLGENKSAINKKEHKNVLLLKK